MKDAGKTRTDNTQNKPQVPLLPKLESSPSGSAKDASMEKKGNMKDACPPLKKSPSGSVCSPSSPSDNDESRKTLHISVGGLNNLHPPGEIEDLNLPDLHPPGEMCFHVRVRKLWFRNRLM